MQEMQQEIHDKSHNIKMIDDDLFYEDLGHFGYAGFSLRGIDRVRELRILSKATSKRLAEMEEEQDNEEEIIKERTLLKAIQEKLSRQERKVLFSEMHNRWP